MISDFHFLRPLWLIALLIPPAILWMASRSGDIRNCWKGMIAPALLDSSVIEPNRRRRYSPAWMLACLAALAVLGHRRTDLETRGTTVRIRHRVTSSSSIFRQPWTR